MGEPALSRYGPESALRVGLNLLWLGERAAGAGRAARGLIEGVLEAEPATEVHLFLARDAPADLEQEPWWPSVCPHRLPVPAGGSLPTLAAQHAALPALALARNLDVLHSPANTGPVIAPRVATAVTLLDLIWWHHPQAWEGDPAAHRAISRQALYAVRRADIVLAISATAADDIATTLGVERERLAVAPLGVSQDPPAQPAPEEQLREELALGDSKVILCVAQKRPYKNIAGLVRALPEVAGILLLPGSRTEHESELRALARDVGVADRVRFVDWVSEEDLEGLYGLADCFVLPSLIEGFGLPVLEAMRRGVPVACSDAGSLPEVTGDAALRFDPHRPEEIAGAIRRLQTDAGLRRVMIRNGLRRCAEFSWRRTGQEALAAYRRAIVASS